MGSRSRETILRHRQEAQNLLAGRLARLQQDGLEEREASRDSVVRRLQARIRATHRQLAVVEAHEELGRRLAGQKAARLERERQEAAGGVPKRTKRAPARQGKHSRAEKRALKASQPAEAPAAD